MPPLAFRLMSFDIMAVSWMTFLACVLPGIISPGLCPHPAALSHSLSLGFSSRTRGKSIREGTAINQGMRRPLQHVCEART